MKAPTSPMTQPVTQRPGPGHKCPPSQRGGSAVGERPRPACGDSLPFPTTGSPPWGASSTQSHSPTAPKSHTSHGSRPHTHPSSRPRHPPTHPVSPPSPSPARLIIPATKSNSPSERRLAGGPRGWIYCGLFAYSWPRRAAGWLHRRQSRGCLFLTPPTASRSTVLPGLGCAPSLSHIHGESSPPSTGDDVQLRWVTPVPKWCRHRHRVGDGGAG